MGEDISYPNKQSIVGMGQAVYNPEVLFDSSGTAGARAALHASLVVEDVVTPSSGVLIFTLSAVIYVGPSSYVFWSLLDEDDVAIPNTEVLAGGLGMYSRVTATIAIEGLTPGETHSYKWAQSKTGPEAVGSGTYAGTGAGNAVISVMPGS